MCPQRKAFWEAYDIKEDKFNEEMQIPTWAIT